MELNEEEKRQLFQVDGDCQAKVLDELYMTARFTRNPEQRDMALYEKAYTADTVKRIASLPHPAVQKFSVITPYRSFRLSRWRLWEPAGVSWHRSPGTKMRSSLLAPLCSTAIMRGRLILWCLMRS